MRGDIFANPTIRKKGGFGELVPFIFTYKYKTKNTIQGSDALC